MIRRTILAAGLLSGLLAPLAAFAQGPPPPVPALPDSPRQTTYTISGTTCACSVGMQLYGDSNDYQNWVEVWLNGKLVTFNDPTFGWTITSATGQLTTIPRPIIDGVLTFNSAQTGTVLIVGAQRPRRLSEFTEGAGVPARAHNQTYNSIVAMLRENWDKTNDLTGRGLFSQPGNIMKPLPSPTACVNGYLNFGPNGLSPQCLSGTGQVQPPTQFNILNYGAPTNGTSDSLPAFTSAIAAASLNGGGCVFVGGGYTFAVSATVQITANNVGICGDGTATITSLAALGDIVRIGPNVGSTTRIQNTFFTGVNIDGNGQAGGTTAGLHIYNAIYSVFSNIRITNINNNGIQADGNPNTASTSGDPLTQGDAFDKIYVRVAGRYGGYFRGVKSSVFANSQFDDAAAGGVYWDLEDQTSGSNETTENTISNIISKNNGGPGFIFSGIAKFTLSNLNAYINFGAGFQFQPTISGTSAPSYNSSFSSLSSRNNAGCIATATGSGIFSFDINGFDCVGNAGSATTGIDLKAWNWSNIANVSILSVGGNNLVMEDDSAPPAGGASTTVGVNISNMTMIGQTQSSTADGIHMSGHISQVMIDGVFTNAAAGTSGYEINLGGAAALTNLSLGNLRLIPNTAGHELTGTGATFFGKNNTNGNTSTAWNAAVTAPTAIANIYQLYVDSGTSLLTYMNTAGTTYSVASLNQPQSFSAQESFTAARTIASGASATLDDINLQAETTTVTGGTNITTAKGFNKVSLYQPTITDSSSVTISKASTLYIDNAPLAAGSVTITQPWALNIGAGDAFIQGANETTSVTDGFGIAVDAAINVQRIATSLGASGTHAGLNIDFQHSTSTAATSGTGLFVTASVPSGSTNYSTLQGLEIVSGHFGTGIISNQFAANYIAANETTGTVSNLYGFEALIQNNGAGTVSVGRGVLVGQPSGPSTSVTAVWTNLTGVEISNQNPTSSGGGANTLTNPPVALLIDSQTASGAYAIKQNGSGLNLFNGTVSSVGGFIANGNTGLSTVCTETVGNTLTFTLGILTGKGANCT